MVTPYAQEPNGNLEETAISSNTATYNPNHSLIAQMRERVPSSEDAMDGNIKRELSCTEEGLNRHMFNHLLPGSIAYCRMARYDVEVAFRRRFALDLVVEKAYESLELDEEYLQRWIPDDIMVYAGIIHGFSDKDSVKSLSITDYKTTIVKTLKYIEQLGLAAVDWERVERSLPGASKVEFDLEKDSNDGVFLK